MLNYAYREFDASLLFIKNKNGKYVRNYEATPFIIENLKMVTGELCSICCKKYTSNNFCTIEHIVCIDENPSLCNDASNLIAACKKCNSSRGNTRNICNLYQVEDLFNNIYISLDGELKVKSDAQDKKILENTIIAYNLNDIDLKQNRFLKNKSYTNPMLCDFYLDNILNLNDLDDLDDIEFPFLFIRHLKKEADIVLEKYRKRWN